jgi:hypothetical protein
MYTPLELHKDHLFFFLSLSVPFFPFFLDARAHSDILDSIMQFFTIYSIPSFFIFLSSYLFFAKYFIDCIAYHPNPPPLLCTSFPSQFFRVIFCFVSSSVQTHSTPPNPLSLSRILLCIIFFHHFFIHSFVHSVYLDNLQEV